MRCSDIRKQVGDSTRTWDWGRSHQIRYVHPLGSARFLRNFFNRGPFPIGGDSTTPLLSSSGPGTAAWAWCRSRPPTAKFSKSAPGIAAQTVTTCRPVRSSAQRTL